MSGSKFYRVLVKERQQTFSKIILNFTALDMDAAIEKVKNTDGIDLSFDDLEYCFIQQIDQNFKLNPIVLKQTDCIITLNINTIH